jgi:cohesin complex subunit SA-1/2
LLNAWRPASEEEENSSVEATSPYTANLYALSLKLISLYNKDANLAHCALLNLLFRSVGGGPDADLPIRPNSETGEEVPILDEMDSNEWARIVTDLVDEMRHSPPNQILICADSGKHKSEGVAEYAEIYKEFWYLLSRSGLRHGHLSTASRLDSPLVSSIVDRLLSLTPVGQPDVRYAASLAVWSMSFAVMEESVEWKKKLNVATRQLEAAKKGKLGDKTEDLKVRVESLKRCCGDLEGVVDSVVQGLFVHRYR